MTARKSADSKITIRKSGVKKSVGKSYKSYWIYLPAQIVKDSAFPFDDEDQITVEIEDDHLVIKKKNPYFDKIMEFGVQNATIPKLLEIKAKKSGNKEFLFFKDDSFTYRQIHLISNKYANALLDIVNDLHLPNTHIALMLSNTPEYLFFWFGISKAGCVFVPIDQYLNEDALIRVITHSDSKILIVEYKLLEKIVKVQKKLPQIKKFIVLNPPEEFESNEVFLNFNEINLENEKNPEVNIKNISNMEIFYPSREVSTPKAIILKHFMVLAGLISAELLKEIGPHKTGTFYVPLPLYHAEIRLLVILTSMFLDLSIVIMEKFNPSKFWDDIIRYKICCFYFIGNVLPLILNQPPRDIDRNHSLKWVFGPEITADIWKIFENRFGVKLFNTWNYMECVPFSINKEGSKGTKLTSKGKLLDIFEVKIINQQKEVLEPGSDNIGEVLIRLKIPLSITYYKRKEDERYFDEEGWIYTGDLGFIDKEGYLFYAGRSEDLIDRGIEVVNAYDIEKIANKHPLVFESAVFEVPIKQSGKKALKICVDLKKEGSITHEALYNYLRENLAYFMVPRFIEFKPQLRNNITEYINKTNLKEEWNSDMCKKKTWDTHTNNFIL
ncbi:MAG: hypothetical protein BAJALOKI1v1_710013 [Promethearchaeota archaeon]|nr:MAG: hypothetical protein BAJALOKI1v1_710013 [Candidatus Lokiarchaeota archaeon]